MVQKINKRSNKTNKKSHKKANKKAHRKSKSQRGGTSSACTLQYSTSPSYSTNSLTNIHNTNPQASLDLDNKFMGYGGPVPLGSSIVGGGSCQDEGVGTGSPKSETFKQYLTNMDAKLSSVTGGSSYQDPMPNSKPNQKAGGYFTETSEMIAGQPVYKGYDDNSPPAIIGGKAMFGSPDQPVCGNGAVRGGARRLSQVGKKSKQSKKSKKNKKNKSRKSRKSQKGGDFTTLHSSKPAEYSSAFNGPVGVFTADMSQRIFDGKQPNWDVANI